MQEVILVREDNHGLIAVASDYFSAVKFLIEENWLDDTCEIGIDEDLKSLQELWGDDWIDEVLALDGVNKFNDTFDGIFYLSIEKIYSAE